MENPDLHSWDKTMPDTDEIMDEKYALHLLRSGDLSGLEFLVDQYYFKAVRTAYLILGDKGRAEEIVQTTYIRLGEAIRSTEVNNFCPWLLKSVINATLKALHADQRFVSMESLEESSRLDQFVETRLSLEEEMLSRERLDQVRAALKELPAELRAVIVQKYHLGWSEKEISDGFHRPVSTIKWWLFTARKRLRAWLVSVEKATADPKKKGE